MRPNETNEGRTTFLKTISNGNEGSLELPNGSAMVMTSRGKRPDNQDSILLADDMIAVADGMGGHDSGALASSGAISYVANHGHSGIPLGNVIRLAHQFIPDSKNIAKAPGTTLAIVKKTYEKGRVTVEAAHVGDSKIYIFPMTDQAQMQANRGLPLISNDQSLVESMLRIGQLRNIVDRYRSELRNTVINSLSARGTYGLPESFNVTGEAQTLLAVIATDGVTDFVTPEEVEELAHLHGEKCPPMIMDLAYSRQGQPYQIRLGGVIHAIDRASKDNISVGAMRC